MGLGPETGTLNHGLFMKLPLLYLVIDYLGSGGNKNLIIGQRCQPIGQESQFVDQLVGLLANNL